METVIYGRFACTTPFLASSKYCLGAYIALFCLCTHILLFVKRRTDGVNKPLLLATIAMFVLCTAHIITELVQAIKTFIHDDSDDPVSFLLTNIQRGLYVTNK